MPELTCTRVEEAISAYIDDEVSDKERGIIEGHLSVCPECRMRYEAGKALRSLIRSRKDRLLEPASPDLRQRVAKAVNAEETQRRWDALSRRRMVGLLSLAASLALCVIGGSLYFHASSPPRSVVSEVVDEHIQCLLKQEGALDFRTASREDLSQWFQSRIDINVAPPRFHPADLRLLGGRLCYLMDRRVAYLMYRGEGKQMVCMFVLDKMGIPLPPGQDARISGRNVRLTAYKGFNVVVWEERGLFHALVADVSQSNLKTLAASALSS